MTPMRLDLLLHGREELLRSLDTTPFGLATSLKNPWAAGAVLSRVNLAVSRLQWNYLPPASADADADIVPNAPIHPHLNTPSCFISASICK